MKNGINFLNNVVTELSNPRTNCTRMTLRKFCCSSGTSCVKTRVVSMFEHYSSLRITKEELLKRISALDDDVIITSDLFDNLIKPVDDSKEEHIDSVNESKKCWYNAIFEYEHIRKNVCEVRTPNIGILPNDLENPIQISGQGWNVKMREQGGFVYHTRNYIIHTHDENVLFSEIDRIVNEHKWIYTYIFSIEEMYNMSLQTVKNIEPITVVRMCGVTEEDVRIMKEKGDDKDSITWVDRAFASGYDIQQGYTVSR